MPPSFTEQGSHLVLPVISFVTLGEILSLSESVFPSEKWEVSMSAPGLWALF